MNSSHFQIDHIPHNKGKQSPRFAQFDLTGKIFTLLTVIRKAGNLKHGAVKSLLYYAMRVKATKKRSKWTTKGRLKKLARLIVFKQNEAELFEAFSSIFFLTDQPAPTEIKASIKAEDLFEKFGVTPKESKFKTAACGYCGTRLGRMPKIYTLPEGKGADLVLDDKVFEYMESRFNKMQQIIDPAMKRPFDILQTRFDDAKTSKLEDYDSISAFLKARDEIKVATAKD